MDLEEIKDATLAEIKGSEEMYTTQKIPETIYGNRDNYEETLEVPSGFKGIYQETFSNFGNVKEVKLPNTLLYIGEKAFENCSSLNQCGEDSGVFKIPNSVRLISSNAFRRCKALVHVVIPGTVHIEKYAFFDCGELQITIERNVGKGAFNIDSEAFLECTSVTINAPPELRLTAGQFTGVDGNKVTINSLSGGGKKKRRTNRRGKGKRRTRKNSRKRSRRNRKRNK